MSAEFEVDVRNHSGVLLGVEWEWDVPEGFQIIGPAVLERQPRLIVTLTRLEEQSRGDSL